MSGSYSLGIANVRLACTECGRSLTRTEPWSTEARWLYGKHCPHCDTKTVTRQWLGWAQEPGEKAATYLPRPVVLDERGRRVE